MNDAALAEQATSMVSTHHAHLRQNALGQAIGGPGDGSSLVRCCHCGAIPPITNHHAATRLAARNTTGISGISYRNPAGDPKKAIWIATMTNRDKQKQRVISFMRYGDEGACKRAITQRENLAH